MCRTTDIPEFQNTNIKIAKDELVYYFIYEFIFCYFFLFLEHLKCLIIFFKFQKFSKLFNFGNFIIFGMKNNKFLKFYNFILRNKKINS